MLINFSDMSKNKLPLLRTVQAREIESKFQPALKVLSSQMHSTGEVPPDFQGYKIPAGTVQDRMGRTWQIQAHAVVQKKSFIKKNEVVPIIRKGAILVRFRIFLKYLIDWANK